MVKDSCMIKPPLIQFCTHKTMSDDGYSTMAYHRNQVFYRRIFIHQLVNFVFIQMQLLENDTFVISSFVVSVFSERTNRVCNPIRSSSRNPFCSRATVCCAKVVWRLDKKPLETHSHIQGKESDSFFHLQIPGIEDVPFFHFQLVLFHQIVKGFMGLVA